MTAEDILDNLRRWDTRRYVHGLLTTAIANPGIQIIESPYMVELGPLRTVRRTWQERLYDWPWCPWQATRTERRWEPREKALYLGGKFIVHPLMAHRLRATLATKWQTQSDPRTTMGQPSPFA